jgi:hypothetical protein
MAAARGAKMDDHLISVGGASLRTHWNKGEALAAIQTGEFDHVVLQEQSTLPIKNAQRMLENIRLFDGAIKSVGATTVLYMTWARKNVAETQAAIADAYLSTGKELGATVIPVGLAWQSFLRKHKTPVLHDKDLSHPTLAGSYLASCVFLAVQFDENPIGIEVEVAGLSEKDVLLLQKAAWETCKSEASKPAKNPKQLKKA